jgi:hypothetical protein
MDRSTFEAIDPHINHAADIIDDLFDSEAISELRPVLVEIMNKLGDRYSVSLAVNLEIFDREREHALPVLQMGLAASEGQEPYKATADSSLQKYVVDGDMQIVPHDYCPRCWGTWDFKLDNRVCGCCGAILGEDIKILLDRDVCPNCEGGIVTSSSPNCEQCGYEVDLTVVTWG